MKMVVLFVVVFAIALGGLLLVSGKLSPHQAVPVTPTPVVSATPTIDTGTALRGPSSNAVYLGGPTAIPYPTVDPTYFQVAPTVGDTITPNPTIFAAQSPTLPAISPTVGTIQPTVTPQPTSAQYTYSTATPIPNSDPSVINYIAAGFSPYSTTVRVGTWVTFKNYTMRYMKIAGDAATVSTYPSFGERVALGQYGFYQFQFTTSGTFHYYDQNSSNYSGTVIVTQ